jgi:hypothetical protein
VRLTLRRVWIPTLLVTAVLLGVGACIGPAPLEEAPPIIPPPATPDAGGELSSVQKWAAAMQPAPIVAFFDGLFHRVGVRVVDTGEAFTCIHAGDRIVFSDELDPDTVDFVVEIRSAQVDRLLAGLRAGELDDAAKFRIMAAISTPATRAMLARPVIRSATMREFLYWVGDSEARMQVVLIAPPGETDHAHTIVRGEDGTTVTPGLHGQASQVYRLTVDDAVEFQRRMMAARTENSVLTWIGFARWYGGFSARVAVPAQQG